MGFADAYLGRHKGIRQRIFDSPSDRLRFSVVIPVYCEPDLHRTLESLWATIRPAEDCEVIMVVNSSELSDEKIKEANRNTILETQEWIRNHDDPSLRFFIIDVPDLPHKEAGAGMARKIGMDEAVFRFNQMGNASGFLLSFDADSICDRNYFTAIDETVSGDSGIQGFDIYFEHPVEGTEYPPEVYQSIIEYELHLRYVNQFLRYSGFPFAHHTVGSCFGVRADVYAAQGGMNKRKGGEDFYFLNKVIPLGHFCDIVTTRVVPSPRPSFRVPFGTGPAITKRIIEGNEMLSYAPECFTDLKNFFSIAVTLFRNREDQIQQKLSGLSPVMSEFLYNNEGVASLMQIDANTGSADAFVNRFYRWFDAFRIVKFLNFSSGKSYPRIRVSDGAVQLLELLGTPVSGDLLQLLESFRKIEKK